MFPLFFSIIFASIEFMSAMVFYKLFLYEETIQIGIMTSFVLGPIKGTGYGQKVSQATVNWGVNPGVAYLDKYGWLVPWAVDAYGVFFRTAKMTAGAF